VISVTYRTRLMFAVSILTANHDHILPKEPPRHILAEQKVGVPIERYSG
jgi:hypothetical protein